jgi:hypothetical protein
VQSNARAASVPLGSVNKLSKRKFPIGLNEQKKASDSFEGSDSLKLGTIFERARKRISTVSRTLFAHERSDARENLALSRHGPSPCSCGCKMGLDADGGSRRLFMW